MTLVPIAVGILVIFIGILLLYASAVLVKSEEVVAVFRWEEYDGILPPGLNFIVPFMNRVERYPSGTVSEEVPGEPEEIDRVNDIPERGKKLPFRIPHKGLEEAIFYVKKEYEPDPNSQEDPFSNELPFEKLKPVRFSQLPKVVQESLRADSLNAPLTSEVSAKFEWHLKREDSNSIKDFITNVTPQGGRDRKVEVRKRAEDMIAAVIQEYLAPTTLGHAIYMVPLFNSLIRQRLEILVGEKRETDKAKEDKDRRPWGIQIDEAFLKPLYAGRHVNTARSEAAASVSQKIKTINDAQAQAESIEVKAVATANATVTQATADKTKKELEGQAEAAYLSSLAAAMEKPGARFVVANETARQVLPKARVIITPPGKSSMADILALGETIFDDKKGENESAA